MSRTSTRLFAIAVGLIAGLIVLFAFASQLRLLDSSTPVPATGTTTLRTVTPVSGAKQIKSFSELARPGAVKSGDLVELRIDEASLNADLTEYLKSNTQGLVVSNTKARLQPGKIILTGTVRQGVLATDFTLNGHPAIVSGQLKLIVDSIEPTLIGQLSPIQPGQSIDLAPNLEARSVTVVEGLMIVVGVAR